MRVMFRCAFKQKASTKPQLSSIYIIYAKHALELQQELVQWLMLSETVFF